MRLRKMIRADMTGSPFVCLHLAGRLLPASVARVTTERRCVAVCNGSSRWWLTAAVHRLAARTRRNLRAVGVGQGVARILPADSLVRIFRSR